MRQIHDTFGVSQLRKSIADETIVAPLEDILIDDRLNYVDKPVAVMDHKVNAFRNKVANLVKVQ